MAALRGRDGIAARALEFVILTATRTSEVLGARWDEIDLQQRLWTVPAQRMKAGREHRVPLSARALAIIERMAEVRTGDLVFAGQRRRRPLSGVTLAALVPGVTIHGFRSSFRIGAETRLLSRARSPSRHWRTRPAMQQSALIGVAMRWKNGEH